LHHYNSGGKGFLSQIFIGDENWVQHFEPESKQQWMKWDHMMFPREKKFKSILSTGEIMVSLL
jgi:hypothetical protein